LGESVNRAIMLGVGIFVTMLIASGVLFIFSQMQEVYSQVGNSDTSISSRFGEFAMYDNTVVTGLGIINCANKYYNDNLIVVELNGRVLNVDTGIQYLNDQVNNSNLKYEDSFISSISEVDYDGLIKTKITFVNK